MEDQELIEILKGILGNEAFNTNNMQVPDAVSKLAKAVNYLATHMDTAGKISVNDEVMEYVDSCIKIVKEILK
jgi:hypothetical protein